MAPLPSAEVVQTEMVVVQTLVAVADTFACLGAWSMLPPAWPHPQAQEPAIHAPEGMWWLLEPLSLAEGVQSLLPRLGAPGAGHQ